MKTKTPTKHINVRLSYADWNLYIKRLQALQPSKIKFSDNQLCRAAFYYVIEAGAKGKS